jgi:hypothetical protein
LLTVSKYLLSVSNSLLTRRKPCRLVCIDQSSYKSRNTYNLENLWRISDDGHKLNGWNVLGPDLPDWTNYPRRKRRYWSRPCEGVPQTLFWCQMYSSLAAVNRHYRLLLTGTTDGTTWSVSGERIFLVSHW